MKFQKSILILMISIIFSYLVQPSAYAMNKKDVDLKILQEIGGSVQEYGIRLVILNCEKNHKKIEAELEKILSINGKTELCNGIINFNFQASNGYIEFTQESNGTIIVDVTETKSLSNMKKLKDSFEASLKKENFKLYYYVKSKLENTTLEKCRLRAEETIKKYSVENINSESISSGCFITANTGSKAGVKDGSKIIDLSCEICKYSSGIYIIIGIPLIYINF